jgi:hypothetical protein
MALITRTGEEQQMTPGMNGTKRVRGVGTFNAQDASGTLPIPLEYVMVGSLQPIGTVAGDEKLSIVGVPNSLGRINRSADGTVTIQRTGAAKTAGLQFFYDLEGR